MIPIITLLGLWLPSLISGALMTETIFALPGLGKISVEAVNARNYPLILGINAMLAMLTLIGALSLTSCTQWPTPALNMIKEADHEEKG